MAQREGESDAARPWRRLLPYPYEIFALVNAAVAWVFLRSHGLRLDWRTVEYVLGPLVKSLPLFLLAGLALATAVVALDRQPVRAFLRGLATVSWSVHWLRLWLAIFLTTYAYAWLKVNVPLVNEHLWDEALWRLDAGLHLGISPTVFLVELVRGTPLVAAMDFWYANWMNTVMFTLCFFTVFSTAELGRRFVFALVLLWGLGAWIYVAFPAVGPIYVYPENWNDLILPRALGTQASLWQNYQIMLSGRTGQIHSFNPVLGVAAMPSLHVGVHAFFAFWCRRHLRPLWVVFLVATLLTFLGSVVTGWHYAIDGYVGVALAWACFRLAERLEAGGGSGFRPARSGRSPRAAGS